MQCSKCVMDGSASEITLDENGVCNFCHQAQKSLKEAEEDKKNLDIYISRINKEGCVIGLSGGVDSSMTLVKAVELGLKPMAFSLDNGYNETKADENILSLVEFLKVPFYRYRIDLDKYRDLQSAFLKGGVKNLEAITDHILWAVSYEMAIKHKAKWILSGGNVATESIMPASWGEDPRDLYWIKSVYKKVKGKKLVGLPLLPLWKEQYYRLIKQIRFFQLLNYFDYHRENSIKYLSEKYGFKPYGEKHNENIFTSWFQNFFLFERYGIDKRKAHFSSLINSGQMIRQQALDELTASPVYPKLGIEDKISRYERKSYDDYPNSKKIRQIISKIYKLIPRRWK